MQLKIQDLILFSLVHCIMVTNIFFVFYLPFPNLLIKSLPLHHGEHHKWEKKGYRLKGYLISNSERSKSPPASEQHQLIFSSSNKNFRFSGIFKNEQKKLWKFPRHRKLFERSANKIENSFEMKNFQMRKFSVRFLACKLVILSFLHKIKNKKLSSSNIRDVHRCT